MAPEFAGVYAVTAGPANPHAAAQIADSNSAWASTVWVAFSCKSGGKPCFLRIHLAITLILARTFCNRPVDADALAHLGHQATVERGTIKPYSYSADDTIRNPALENGF